MTHFGHVTHAEEAFKLQSCRHTASYRDSDSPCHSGAQRVRSRRMREHRVRSTHEARLRRRWREYAWHRLSRSIRSCLRVTSAAVLLEIVEKIRRLGKAEEIEQSLVLIPILYISFVYL